MALRARDLLTDEGGRSPREEPMREELNAIHGAN
jgi:hypothetical protein